MKLPVSHIPGHLAGAGSGMQGAGILGRESISSEKTKLKCPDLACVDNRAARCDTFFCQAQGPGQIPCQVQVNSILFIVPICV